MQSVKKSSTTKKAGSKKQPAVKKASTKPSSTPRKKAAATPTKSAAKKQSRSVKAVASKKSVSPTRKGFIQPGPTMQVGPSSGEVRVSLSGPEVIIDAKDLPSSVRETIYDGWATIHPTPETKNVTLDPHSPFESALVDLVRTHREKSKGYGAEDPFRNFYLVALQENITPLQACNTLLGKHQAFLANRNRDPWPLDSAAVMDAYLDRAVYSVIAEAIRRRQCDGHMEVPDLL